MSELLDDRRYAKTHEWAKLTDDGTACVGISDHAQQELGDLVYIELPEVGRRVTSGEACAVVESVKAASDIFSPVAGEIAAINEAVVEAPELVNEDAYAAWLFRVLPDDAQALDQLLDAEAYRATVEE
jgi:glycine cleavage system H protein